MPITESIPQRIISLTPSLTETLFALNSGDRVCGVTDSCDYPAEAENRPNVACWFDPDLDKLFGLKPDLVVGLKTAHAHLKPEIEARGIAVLLLNPATVDEAIADIARIGKMLDARETVEKIVADLHRRLARL